MIISYQDIFVYAFSIRGRDAGDEAAFREELASLTASARSPECGVLVYDKLDEETGAGLQCLDPDNPEHCEPIPVAENADTLILSMQDQMMPYARQLLRY